MSSPLFPFDVVIVTSPNNNDKSNGNSNSSSNQQQHFCHHRPRTIVEALLKRHLPSHVQLVSTCDPFGGLARCGSGGGTLAALDEYYKYNGYSYNPIKTTKDNAAAAAKSTHDRNTILMIHAGGESSRCPTQMVLGKAWTSLPFVQQSDQHNDDDGYDENDCDERSSKSSTKTIIISNPTVLLVQVLARLCVGIPKGSIVVAASDCLLDLPFAVDTIGDDMDHGKRSFAHTCFNMNRNAVVGVAVPAPLETASHHGVYCLRHCDGDRERRQQPPSTAAVVTQFLQKPTISQMQDTPHCVINVDSSNDSITAVETTKTTPTCSDRGGGTRNGVDEHPQEQQEHSPMSSQQRAWIDTGVIMFVGDAADRLKTLATEDGTLMQRCTERGLRQLYEQEQQQETSSLHDFAKRMALRVELYTHIVMALSCGEQTAKKDDNDDSASFDAYLKACGEDGPRHNDNSHHGVSTSASSSSSSLLPLCVLQELYKNLSPCRLNVIALSQGSFRHLGTSRELLDFYASCKSSAGGMKQGESFLATGGTTQLLSQQPRLVQRANAVVPCSSLDLTAMNTVVEMPSGADCSTFKVGQGTVLEHVHIITNDGTTTPTTNTTPYATVDIGSHCLVSGVRGTYHKPLVIPNGLMFQMIVLKKSESRGTLLHPEHVYMYLGVDDGIKSGNTMWTIPMEHIWKWTGLDHTALWKEEDTHSVWKARIHPIVQSKTKECVHEDLFYWITELLLQFQHENESSDAQMSEKALRSLAMWKRLPRLSLSEIRMAADAVAEHQYREHLEQTVLREAVARQSQRIRNVLMNRRHSECNLESVIGSFASTGGCWSEEGRAAVTVLKDVMMDAFAEEKYDICGRASMIACHLFSRLALTIRDDKGPSAEATCKTLNNLNVADGDSVRRLVSILDTLLESNSSARSLTACANAMERCAFAMTQRCVTNLASPRSCPRMAPAPLNTWVIATAPARLDLAGGWSDTPPICVEHGGAVCCVAVTVDGKKPLSCRCRLVTGGRGIVLRSEARNTHTGDISSVTTVLLEKIGDLEGYRNPKSDCSLLKCALVYCGLVSADKLLSSPEDDLTSYLKLFCGCENVGLEIVTTSLLPHGSGMGTSSILGGCVLSAITTCVGIDISGGNFDVFLMVLMLEQLLCTGGGWQDQVGGLVGGAKLCTSQNSLPLQISVEDIPLAPDFVNRLNQRMLLAFTGQTRLAKNILQTVLRHWARRSKNVVETVEELTTGAHRAKGCLANHDFDGLAECLNAYWIQKKVMAGESSEPPVVRAVLTELLARDLIQAGSLCGAGGGGFMILLLSEGRQPSEIEQFCLDELDLGANEGFTWHECRFSQEGLSIVLGESCDSDVFDMSWHSPNA